MTIDKSLQVSRRKNTIPPRRDGHEPRVAVAKRNQTSGQYRRGLSLLELLACLTIMGILAAVLVPRISIGTSETKSGSCHVHREVVEVQAALWHRSHGRWPASSLSDIGSDRSFFPEGLPTCPVDGSAYQIDSSDGKVVGHQH